MDLVLSLEVCIVANADSSSGKPGCLASFVRCAPVRKWKRCSKCLVEQTNEVNKGRRKTTKDPEADYAALMRSCLGGLEGGD